VCFASTAARQTLTVLCFTMLKPTILPSIQQL
jgi:hypothetical protein